MAKSLSLCPCFREKNMHFLYYSFLICKMDIIMAIKFRELPDGLRETVIMKKTIIAPIYGLHCAKSCVRDLGSIPGLGRYPGEGNGNPTQVFLPRKSQGQKKLAGYRPWGPKELDMTENT